MNILRHIFRDVSSGLLMTVGYAMLFFIAFNGVYMINRMTAAQPDTIMGNYKYKCGMNLLLSKTSEGAKHEETENLSYLLDTLKNVNANVILKVPCNINNASRTYTANFLTSYKEPFNRMLESGAYPSPKEAGGERFAIIGNFMKDYAYEREGVSYIKINGEEYRIAGVFKDISVGGYDDALLAYSPYKEDIEKNIIYVTMRGAACSNNDSNSNLHEEIKQIVQNNTDYTVRDDYSGIDESINSGVKFTKNCILVLLFIFCGSNSLVIANLWIRRRQREIAIRKAYGYNIFNVLGWLSKDLLKLMLLSVILAAGLQVIYGMIIQRPFEIRFVSSAILYFVALIAGVMIVTIAINIKLVTGTAPSQGVRGDI